MLFLLVTQTSVHVNFFFLTVVLNKEDLTKQEIKKIIEFILFYGGTLMLDKYDYTYIYIFFFVAM